MAFIPFSFATSKSTPPGAEAKSIIRDEVGTEDKTFLSTINDGMC